MPSEDFYKGYSFQLFSLDVFISTIFVFIFLFIIPFLFQASIFKPFKEALSDFEITDIYFSSVLPSLDLPKETDIIIINTGMKTLDGLKELNDVAYLKVIKSLEGQGISVLGIDHEFNAEPNTQLFEVTKSVLSSENVVLANDINYLNNLKKINKNNVEYGYNSGYNYYLPKSKQSTKTARKFIPRYINNLDTFYHYGIKIAEQYNPDAVKRLFKRDKAEERINFKGNWDKYEIINASQVFQGNYPEDYFRNKIVLMGVIDTSGTSDDFNRLYYTPLNETTSGRTFPDMYKTIITANIISMVITDDYFSDIQSWIVLLITFILCYFNMVLFGYIGYKSQKWYELLSTLTFVIESFLVVFLTVNLFYEYKIEIDLTLVILASALSTVVYELYTDSIKPVFLLAISKLK